MTYKQARIEALEREVQRLSKENEALKKVLDCPSAIIFYQNSKARNFDTKQLTNALSVFGARKN